MKNTHIQHSHSTASAAFNFNRVSRPCRKVMPTLTQRIKEMFNYAG